MLRVRCRLCYMHYMCAHCVTRAVCAVYIVRFVWVTCAHIVLHVRFVRVTCAHIVLHVRTLCYMCGAHCVTCVTYADCEAHMR